MATLIVAEELDDAIDQLYETAPQEADAAVLLLQLLWENDAILSSIRPPETVHQYSPTFEFKLFEEAQKRGLNVYILKYWDPDHGHLCNHRILVGYDPQKDRYYALTLEKRGGAYDPNSANFAELEHRYRKYGIPSIPGTGRR